MAAPTVIKVTDDPTARRAALKPAAEAIRSGHLVIFPTETVYGVAVCTEIPAAVEHFYRIKQRSPDKPCSFHVGTWDMIQRIAGDVPVEAMRTLEAHLPGPYTFLLDVKGVKVGFRFPICPVAQTFLALCDVPVMASSANIRSQPSPTDAEMTSALWPEVAMVIDAGPTELQGDSTIVDLTVTPPQCVRRGTGQWP